MGKDGLAHTWHRGVVARYWAEFNTGGPEIDYFHAFVERGQPALDLACGTGRLLLPYLRAGLDVDGCDASADMIDLCRAAAELEGFRPNLYVQPMHGLEIPRRYGTIFICGGFGLGANREQERAGLRRLLEHLEPGGTLVFDYEMPYADADQWQYWLKSRADALPQPWPQEGRRRTAGDGTDYELRVRTVKLDPVEARLTLEIWARQWRADELLADERNTLSANLYLRPEVELMLEHSGFTGIEVLGHYTGRAPTREDDFLVFVARRPFRR